MTRLSFIGLFLLIGKKHFSFIFLVFWIVALTLKMPSQNDGGGKSFYFLWRHFCTFMSEKKKNDYWCTHTTYFQGEALYISVGFSFFIEIKKKEVQGPVSLAVTVKGPPPACV
jgi:hypothetical protein